MHHALDNRDMVLWTREVKDKATQMTSLDNQLRDIVKLLNYYKNMCILNMS